MENCTTIVGLDVHKDSITAAVLPRGSDRVIEVVRIINDPAAVEKLVGRLTAAQAAVFVYEAGPCGYELHRQITGMGHRCAIIAPALIPTRPGDRIKTDRRDAEKLARYHRTGDLTEIRVPTREEEAARDLPRVREDALDDRMRARHRLAKFLLRQGRIFRETKAWGSSHRRWLESQRFDWETQQRTFEAYVRAVDEAQERLTALDQQVEELAKKTPYQKPVQYLSCLKGIDTLSALTLLVEAQDFRRFEGARGFMKYTGMIPREHSSGAEVRRGGITKAGNAHLRRILVEAAWSYRRRSRVSHVLTKRRAGCPAEVVAIAKKAQDRLERKYSRMVNRGKLHQIAVVAVARELAGFIWAISHRFPATTES